MKKTKAKKFIPSRQKFYFLMPMLVYFGASFIYGFHHWLNLNFNGPNMETIATLLMFGTSGLSAPAYYYYTGVIYIIIMPMIFALIAYGIENILAKRIGKKQNEKIIIRSVLSLSIFIISFGIFFNSTQAGNFIKNRIADNPDYFAEYYIDPKNVTITAPAIKKNLVVIWVESMEDSYGKPVYYKENLYAPLKPMEEKSMMPFLYTTGNAVHTQAGHVASQCGLPMKAVFGVDYNDQDGNPTLLQNAVCLSDILSLHGYRNVFLQSAFRNTAGLGDFYSQVHRFDEAYFLEHFQANGYGKKTSQDMGIWGLHDAPIIKEGYQKLESLQKSGQPFFLSMATIDFHFPASSSCTYGKTEEAFEDVVTCTSRAIQEFITNAEQNGLLKNTEVFVMGDHLTIAIKGVDMADWNKAYPQRGVYNFFYNRKGDGRRATITHYDIFPTLLEILGFEIAGSRLGFGYSLLRNFPNYPDEQQWDDMMERAFLPSPTYIKLWQK